MPDEQTQYVTVYDGSAIVDGVSQRTQATTDAQTIALNGKIDEKVDEQTQQLSSKIETTVYETNVRTDEQLQQVADSAAAAALTKSAEQQEGTTIVVIDSEQYATITGSIATANALSLTSVMFSAALVGVCMFQILSRGWQW